MFGYLRVDKDDLKVREFDQYQGVYCTLCRTLGKRYGLLSRLALSYDLTFMAIYAMSLSPECPGFTQGRCSFRPWKKCARCGGKEGTPAIERAADVSVILMYYKLEDAMADERGFRRVAARVARFLFRRAFQKACALRPDAARAAAEYMGSQRATEAARTPVMDRAAEPTARMIAFLASEQLPREIVPLAERFGYCLGRFIYLSDAADDLADDAVRERYNPYLLQGEETFRAVNAKTLSEYAAQSLYACRAVCVECFRQLPVRYFQGILQNALVRGMAMVIRQVTQKEAGKERKIR